MEVSSNNLVREKILPWLIIIMHTLQKNPMYHMCKICNEITEHAQLQSVLQRVSNKTETAIKHRQLKDVFAQIVGTSQTITALLLSLKMKNCDKTLCKSISNFCRRPSKLCLIFHHLLSLSI